MIKWVKLHFIPHDGNDHQPHFLRFKIGCFILLLVLLLEAVYLTCTMIVLPRSEYFAAIFATVLIDETNQVRQTDHLASLTVNPILEKAALLKAEDMAAKGYFSHNTPDGKTPWYWFEQAGYDYAAAGENLAVNFTDSKDVTEAWMRSPTHRANIMNGNYTEIGIATARGMYKGKEAIFVVQEFGRPSIIARQIEIASSTVTALTKLITQNDVTTEPTPAPVIREVSVTPSTTPRVLALETVQGAAEPQEEEIVQPIIPTRTVVAGAETEKLDTEKDVVLAPTSNSGNQATRIEELVASPRSIANSIYLFLGGLLAFALALAIFIRIRIQHAHIIANGTLLIGVICLLVMINAVLVASSGVI